MRKMGTALEAVTLKELHDLGLFSQCLKREIKQELQQKVNYVQQTTKLLAML